MTSPIDRLAAARAQRSQAAGIEITQTPPHSSGVNDATSGISTTAPTQSAFFSEVASIQADIQRLNGLVDQIAATHAQIHNTADTSGEEVHGRLDQLTMHTRRLMQDVKDRVHNLEILPAHQSIQIRRNQISILRTKFLESLQRYQRVEYDADLKSKQTIERQLRFVKPDATPDEVNAFIEGGSQQVFAQALITSTRYGESRQAFRELEQRQHELQRMENTLTDLTRLFNDMGFLIEQQEPVIQQVDKTAQEITENTGKALENAEKAVIHARRYRKGKWICFGLFLAICAILALVLGLTLGLRKRS